MTLADWIAAGAQGSAPVGPLDERVDALVAAAMESIREDYARARHFASVAAQQAKKSREPLLKGKAARMLGHVNLLGGRARPAVKAYERAWSHFADAPLERANTAVAMIQALAYIGQYDRAFGIAEIAVEIYDGAQDELRAARVRANLANALQRLDRLDEARKTYQAAIQVLAQHRAQADLAIVMRNYAVCLMGLADFAAAEEMYAIAREAFVAEGSRLLVLEVDLNRAYLRGRQGLVREALVAYRDLRTSFPEDAGYEIGHCLLDQADFLLESGLWTDAIEAADQAIQVFARLSSQFELGKAHLLRGMAHLRRGQIGLAQSDVNEARPRLRREPNQNWRAMLLTAQAELDRARGRWGAARRAMEKAASLDSIPERQPLIRQIWVELLIAEGDLEAAATALGDGGDPAQRSQLARLNREPERAAALAREALKAYDDRRDRAESTGLRRSLAAVQEKSLREAFRSLQTPIDRHSVVSRLKDQALAELIELPANLSQMPSGLAEYRVQLALAPRQLQATAAQAVLPAHSAFIELFADEGNVFAFVHRSDGVEEIALGPESHWFEAVAYFEFHRSRLSPSGERLATKALTRIGELLSPALKDAPPSLIFGRDRPLMTAPLHAVIHGGEILGDRHEVSYAPSLSAWTALQTRPRPATGTHLVFGAPDELAPAIAEEVTRVGAQLKAQICRTADEFLDRVTAASVIHLAAHGLVREDLPMFSAMRLGSREWTVFDVVSLRLRAHLTVLSGCSTGVSLSGESRESQGFIEALLAAGSQSVMAALWDVHDESTRLWMERFYVHAATQPLARAYQLANRDVRQAYPHPGLWAPFGLFGAIPQKPVFSDHGGALSN
jgi:tetratricopeptide (TPR) repeat protein